MDTGGRPGRLRPPPDRARSPPLVAIEDEVWDYIGACAPIDLRSSLSEDEVLIAVRDLERAARYL